VARDLELCSLVDGSCRCGHFAEIGSNCLQRVAASGETFRIDRPVESIWPQVRHENEGQCDQPYSPDQLSEFTTFTLDT
jgi:hypothetical protein